MNIFCEYSFYTSRSLPAGNVWFTVISRDDVSIIRRKGETDSNSFPFHHSDSLACRDQPPYLETVSQTSSDWVSENAEYQRESGCMLNAKSNAGFCDIRPEKVPSLNRTKKGCVTKPISATHPIAVFYL